MGENVENITVGNKIKALRKKCNLTRKQLAEQLEINYSTLANYENDNRNLPTELLAEISDIFNVSMDFFFNKNTNDYEKWKTDIYEVNKAFTEAKYDDMVAIMGDAWGAQAPILYREFIKSNGKVVPLREILISYFEELNQIGKKEAVKRIEELTHIDKYTCDDKTFSTDGEEI